MIEAKRGWANTISTKQDYNEILGGLGKRFESALNTYKPFACGIVMHPAIDAAIQLRNENKLTADQIERVDLKVHPLVLELTGKKSPREGLEGKFSIYHAVAIAIVEGAGGEKQFSDRAVSDPTTVALRGKVSPVITPGIDPAQVDMTVVLKDGAYRECQITNGQVFSCSGWFQGKTVAMKDGAYHLCDITNGQVFSCDGSWYQGKAVVRH